MRTVRVQSPSFPEAAENVALVPDPGLRWSAEDALAHRSWEHKPGEAR